MYHIINVESKTHWLQQRNNGVGGSDISVLMDANPYKNYTRLLEEKTQPARDNKPTEAMLRGQREEVLIITNYNKKHGTMLRRNKDLFVFDAVPIAQATPDAHIGKAMDGKPLEHIVECKSSRAFITDKIRMARLQTQWYMGITGAKTGTLAVLERSKYYLEYPLTFDAKLFDEMLKRAEAFWKVVLEERAKQE